MSTSEPSERGEAEPPPPSRRTIALRWALALAIGAGGAYAVQRVALSVRSNALARVVLLDFARFEGCLFGPRRLPDGALPDAAVAMAQGAGDPAWPHSCAPPLTRIEHAADEARGDSTETDALARAVSAMQAALGDAVIWTRHVQAGQRNEPPTWVGPFVALRHEVEAFASHRGTSLRAPETPRQPRVPRSGDAPEPPPAPVPLDGGDEADILDAAASGEEIAVILRDRRTRYTICRVPSALPPGAPVACERFEVPRIADPRYAGFAPSERDAHLAVWGRAPYSLRGLVELTGRRIALITAGDPDARRDYWVAPDARVIGVQIDREVGPSLLVAPRDAGGATSLHRLPASADVLTEDRALLGTPRGAAEVWLDTRPHDRSLLRAVPVGLDGVPRGAPATLATWHAPRMSGQDRRLLPCAVPGGAAFVAAGDARDVEVLATEDGATFAHWPAGGRGLTADTELACDSEGVAVVTRRADELSALACDARGCDALPGVPVRGAHSVARAGGALVIADAGGADDALRVRTVRRDPAGSAVTVASTIAEPLPPARDVRLAARANAVALFVAARQTFALLSRDGGRSFVPAAVVSPSR